MSATFLPSSLFSSGTVFFLALEQPAAVRLMARAIAVNADLANFTCMNEHLQVVAEDHFDFVREHELPDNSITEHRMVQFIAQAKAALDAVSFDRGRAREHLLVPLDFDRCAFRGGSRLRASGLFRLIGRRYAWINDPFRSLVHVIFFARTALDFADAIALHGDNGVVKVHSAAAAVGEGFFSDHV